MQDGEEEIDLFVQSGVGLALGEGNVIGGSVPLFQRHGHSSEDF